MRTIEQLKTYFENAELPETLDGMDRFYNNPKWTVHVLLKSAEDNPSDTKSHKRAVRNLNILIVDLEDKKNWNIKRDGLEGVYSY